jgi:activating signal cointegrator complex subunit 3
MDLIIENIRDPNLKLCLAFGLGLHHAGLQDKDRKIVEELFVNQHIQVRYQHSVFKKISKKLFCLF